MRLYPDTADDRGRAVAKDALVILTLMLALFMLNVPVLAAFTVARYERA